MASNMKANDPGGGGGGGGANRLDRLAALARDQRPVQDEVDQIADVANQANLYIRNNLANMAGAADILENLTEDRDENGEPSNFQDSEPDQDMEEEVEELGGDNDSQAGGDRDNPDEVDAAFERLEYDRTDRFDRHMFRSLSLEHGDGPGDSLPLIGGSPSLASLPSNHNPFLGEPSGNNSGNGNGNFAGAGADVRNVNQRPGTLYNWQATKTTIKEFMFNNEILADVHFKVRNYL